MRGAVQWSMVNRLKNDTDRGLKNSEGALMRDDRRSGWPRSRSFRQAAATRKAASCPHIKTRMYPGSVVGSVGMMCAARDAARHCARPRFGALQRGGRRTFQRCCALLRRGARRQHGRRVHVYRRMHRRRRAESCDSCCVGAASGCRVFPENG